MYVERRLIPVMCICVGVTPSPATPFAERGRVLVVAKERNYRTYQLDNKILTRGVIVTPWQRMQSMKSADLIGHIKFAVATIKWLQCDQTLPHSVASLELAIYLYTCNASPSFIAHCTLELQLPKVRTLWSYNYPKYVPSGHVYQLSIIHLSMLCPTG